MPEGFTEIDDLIREFEKDPEKRAALEEGRNWIKELKRQGFPHSRIEGCGD